MQGHVIAVLRSDVPVDDQVERLGRILLITPYEARQHASVPKPRAVASRATAEEAAALAQRLTGEGLEAAVFSPESLLADGRRFLCRTLRVAEDGVAGQRKDGAEAHLAWGDVAAIFVGVRKGVSFVDVIDAQGAVFTARERDTLFDANSGLGVSGGRAGVLALAQHARARSNGRFEDRLLKPATLAQVCGAFASTPDADDLAETLLWRVLTT